MHDTRTIQVRGVSMDRIRILIADDHPFFRDGLRVLMDATPDTELVGEATGGEEAVTLAAEIKPDVILMDLRMPGLGGIEATRKVLEEIPETGILVVTMVEDDDSVFAAMRAGARGYLLKESEGADIARAVRAAARSEAVFGPRIADRVLAFFASSRGRTTAVPFPELTDREREVLDLVAHGLPNAAIATRLFLSEKTVRNRVSDVLTKLHAASRAEAVALARDAGLGPA
jgi:DNA-binding NarL/FixJ family response regulator